MASTPSEYFVWYGIHPTARVHEMLGNAAYAAVVPEPEVYALVGVGFGLIALIAARRRTV
jgi:phospholipase/lecithinase/hemolysin